MELGTTLSYRVQSTLLKNNLAAAETQAHPPEHGESFDYERAMREL